ncbi:hypothetical protein [Motiliproteus sp. MSK22-1]|nr:hypothetical protein [Motiliproteus sp. MSK22-1]
MTELTNNTAFQGLGAERLVGSAVSALLVDVVLVVISEGRHRVNA